MWGSGNQATFNLECRNGKAFIKMETHLGHPSTPHFHSHHPSQQQVLHPGKHGRPRHKSSRQIQRDKARAATHHARLDQQLAASATELSDTAATALIQNNDTSSVEPTAATDVEISFTQLGSQPPSPPSPEPGALSG